MYGSTCADMQVDVMGRCLSSIKHVVGTTSGCFYPRSNHWEVGGRPQCDKCGCRVRIAHSIVSRLWRQFQTTGTAIREFSSGRPRGTTPADDRYIVYRGQKTARWYESRFSLSSDSHGILSGESGSRNHPQISLKGCMEVAVFLFEEASCLRRYGSAVPFHDDNAPCHRTVAAEQLLESEDTNAADWPARSPDLNPIENVAGFSADAWQLVPYHQ
ncbi:transposable element Tcb1 transposase [Trichonephila clavipes]|nr:transposable element Tcb1 transposase [Trichonephila clavipes]